MVKNWQVDTWTAAPGKMQQETRLEETQMPKIDKWTAVKMHVSSVEDTIRPEIFEAPLRSAHSF